MHATELRRYKEVLLAKLGELSAAKAAGAAPVMGAGGPLGDLVDQANADAEAELQVRLRQTDGRLARAIDEALARIRQGTYGVCEACGHPISIARLEAVPWTRLCRKCKEQQGA
jgi:DnaK suppressor protein